MSRNNEANIHYWIYELNMPPQVKVCLDAICKATGMSSDELFQTTIRENLKWAKEAPDEYRKSIMALLEEEKQHPLGIEVIRYYPVYIGETEEQAHERAVKEEESIQDEHGTAEAEAE